MAATVQSSACERALLLPELLAAIFAFLEPRSPELLACLRVSTRAARIWGATCGGYDDSVEDPPRPRHPSVHHLAALAGMPARLQWCAQHVEALRIEMSYCGPGYGDEASLLPFLADVAFPRRTVFKMGSWLSRSIPRDEDYPVQEPLRGRSRRVETSNIVPFLQLGLRSCHLEWTALSNELFATMQVR